MSDFPFHHCGGTDPLCNCQVEDMERRERMAADRTCAACHTSVGVERHGLPSGVFLPLCEACREIATSQQLEAIANGVDF
jgi:hypothetical protein